MTGVPTAVFDTNVLVSGFLSPEGPPGRIVDWLRSGTVRAVVVDGILAEYAEVLHRPELALPDREVDIVSAPWSRRLAGLAYSPNIRSAEMCRILMMRRSWRPPRLCPVPW